MEDARTALARTDLEKTLTMERSVSHLRALVIGVNIAAWFLFLGPGSPRAPIAMTIVVTASLYAIWSLFGRPYERFPLLRFGAATLTMDAFLILLWVYATGGPSSEYWVIFMVSVVSVAMRYDLRQTVRAACGEALLYLMLLMLDGGTSDIGTMIRPAYIVITGVAAGMLARQERVSREDRLRFQRLAGEHATMLARERETVEQLRALDRMRVEFVASASHELRTPLTTLAGFAKMLSTRGESMPPDMRADALKAMERQGSRIATLIDNLLDLSQLEHGNIQMRLSEVSLASAISTALDTAPPPPDHEVAVHVDGVVAVADRARLEQVLTNLLVNAYRYGGAHITVSASGHGDRVDIVVHDDGMGVPDDLLPKLFEPFGRGSNVGDQVGSGLGLAICKKLVEAFGGNLHYENDQGATFSISLRAA